MPVPDQVQDDGSGIQNVLKSLDSGFRRNDKELIFWLFTNSSILNVQNVWDFEFWSLRFIWNLDFEFWDLNNFIPEKEELKINSSFVCNL